MVSANSLALVALLFSSYTLAIPKCDCYTATEFVTPTCQEFFTKPCVRPMCAYLTTTTIPGKNRACPTTPTVTFTEDCPKKCPTGCFTFTSTETVPAPSLCLPVPIITDGPFNTALPPREASPLSTSSKASSSSAGLPPSPTTCVTWGDPSPTPTAPTLPPPTFLTLPTVIHPTLPTKSKYTSSKKTSTSTKKSSSSVPVHTISSKKPTPTLSTPSLPGTVTFTLPPLPTKPIPTFLTLPPPTFLTLPVEPRTRYPPISCFSFTTTTYLHPPCPTPAPPAITQKPTLIHCPDVLCVAPSTLTVPGPREGCPLTETTTVTAWDSCDPCDGVCRDRTVTVWDA